MRDDNYNKLYIFLYYVRLVCEYTLIVYLTIITREKSLHLIIYNCIDIIISNYIQLCTIRPIYYYYLHIIILKYFELHIELCKNIEYKTRKRKFNIILHNSI